MTRTRTTFNIVLHFRVEGGWRSKRGSGGECAMCYLYMQWCGEFDRIERHWREVSQHRRVGGWGGDCTMLLTYTMGQLALCQARGSWLMSLWLISHVSTLMLIGGRLRDSLL